MISVVIVGAGGLGGVMAARLAAHANVTLVSTNDAIRQAVEADGVHMRSRREQLSANVTVVDVPPAGANVPIVILATQPPQVEDAARSALASLAPDGRMVVVQNGLCEERVAAIVGTDRVVGGIVAWGATMEAPGRYHQTALGGFTLGRIDGTTDPHLSQLAELLGHGFPVRITSNLRGARFSKLAINAAISSLGTIAGERLGPLVAVRRYRRLALEIMTEAVLVARAEKVVLEKVSGTLDLDWIALTDAEKTAPRGSPGLVLKHAMLRAVGLRYRSMRSSMLAAIERGRVPAVDFLGGEIVTRGQRHGIATPANRAVVDTVWAIANGTKQSSRQTLDELIDSLR